VSSESVETAVRSAPVTISTEHMEASQGRQARKSNRRMNVWKGKVMREMRGTVFGCGEKNYRFPYVSQAWNDLCGLVVRVSGYRSRVRFPALPHFLINSGSRTESTQPRECN
jgi:hypothetical protein